MSELVSHMDALLDEQVTKLPEKAQALNNARELLREELCERLHSLVTLDDEEDLINNPPIIKIAELSNGSQIYGIDYRVVPGHSSKVIPMQHMFEQAEARGEISTEATPTLIIASSGNGAIWLTKIARKRGYKVIVVTMDYASVPRLNELKALGAEVRLGRGEEGVQILIDMAEKIENSTPGTKFLNQTHSSDNTKGFVPQGRRVARKLLLQGITPTHFIAGVGTGGTFTGLTQGIRKLAPECIAVAVEVGEKPFLANKYPAAQLDVPRRPASNDRYWIQTYGGASQVPGLAANIECVNLNRLFDAGDASVITVSNLEAQIATRTLASEYQQFAGPSTGAAFEAAMRIAESGPDAKIIIPICDTGMRYEGELWHGKKRKNTSEIKDEEVGSRITVCDIVHQGMSTPHMHEREMGGPFSTAALLDMMELACHDLEIELGWINDADDSVGLGVDGSFKHLEYVPLGTKITVEAELISTELKNGHRFSSYRVQTFAINAAGEQVPVCNPIFHKRCTTNMRELRDNNIPRYQQSTL